MSLLCGHHISKLTRSCASACRCEMKTSKRGGDGFVRVAGDGVTDCFSVGGPGGTRIAVGASDGLGGSGSSVTAASHMSGEYAIGAQREADMIRVPSEVISSLVFPLPEKEGLTIPPKN